MADLLHTTSVSQLTTNLYTAVGALQDVHYPNGVHTGSGNVLLAQSGYRLNTNGWRLGATEILRQVNGTYVINQLGWGYDGLGRLTNETCSSLPVLQVAVGRRLGYPLKLVTTKGHLFVRWEDSGERFNVEAAGNGVNRFSDDYAKPNSATPMGERVSSPREIIDPLPRFGPGLTISRGKDG